MNLLAIDTATEACSVAVQVGDVVREQHVVEPRQHTKILVPMIRRTFASAGIGTGDLDAVVLGNGPGSFIGMRIGASIAQGICYGAGIDIVPVSSLLAVAAEVFQTCTEDHVVVAQDARMNEVYVGIFNRGPQGRPMPAMAERILPVGEIDGVVAGSLAVGSAWQTYEALAEANAKLVKFNELFNLPRARYLLPLGLAALSENLSVPPQLLTPAYLRDKVAEPNV